MVNNIRIYLASSWKNEKAVLQVANHLRLAGLDVDCFAERNHGEYVANPEDDGITSLKSDYSKRVCDVAKQHMDWANCCVLLNPCGRDAHIEAGYIKGKGGRLYILGLWPKGEFSFMYHLADGLYRMAELQIMAERIKQDAK